MKKILFVISLGISLTAMSCSSNDTKAETTDVSTDVTIQQTKTVKEDVNVEKFAELVNSEKGQVLDVRTPKEWGSGIIKGAIKMNFFDKDFEEQLTKLDKTKPVYVYCKVGGRSGKAAKKLNEMGFTHVYNLVGGIGAWNAAGKEKVR